MRININLATEPYVHARRFWFRWGLALAGVIALTIGLGYAAVADLVSAGGMGRQIRRYKAEIAERDRERAQAEAFLNRPENRDIRDRSQFINELIARKAFAWTQVFASLEKLVPPGLQVVSIQPQLNEDHQLELKMVVAVDDRGRAVELVRRLEGSPQFRQAQIRSEVTADQQAEGGRVKFEITAQYVPDVFRGVS